MLIADYMPKHKLKEWAVLSRCARYICKAVLAKCSDPETRTHTDSKHVPPNSWQCLC